MKKENIVYLSLSIALFLLIVFVLFQSGVVNKLKDMHKTTPVLNDGKKWRVAYYEGGPYINYPANLRTMVAGLAGLGWIKDEEIPETEDILDAKSVWQLLGGIDSDYIEFVSDAYWSANWNATTRETNKEDAIKRLQSGDIDFIIAMGTWAGQDLVNNNHSVPTMVVSTSDPVKSNIIVSPEDSGFDHVHAKSAPERYIRQLQIFYDFFKFKRLGVVYEDSVDGRTYAAIEDIEKVAKDKGFEIVTCQAPFSGVSKEESTAGIIKCHEELAPKIDALYLTVHTGVDLERMDEIMAPMIEYKIPTWSQRGPGEVKEGVLMSISRGGFRSVGQYHAEVMAKIFNGIKPRDISQVYYDPKLIAINLDAANEIGYVPPENVMTIADEVY